MLEFRLLFVEFHIAFLTLFHKVFQVSLDAHLCRMSSCINNTLSITWYWRLWNSSGAEERPKGNCSQWYLPKGVLNVVSFELSSSSSMCQKSFLTSNVLKTLARLRSGRISSMVGNG